MINSISLYKQSVWEKGHTQWSALVGIDSKSWRINFLTDDSFDDDLFIIEHMVKEIRKAASLEEIEAKYIGWYLHQIHNYGVYNKHSPKIFMPMKIETSLYVNSEDKLEMHAYVEEATFENWKQYFKTPENLAEYDGTWLSQPEGVESSAARLPAINACVDYPCDCPGSPSTVRAIIMHLNDWEKWSREKIADWLDELHDSGKINIEFDPWKEENED